MGLEESRSAQYSVFKEGDSTAVPMATNSCTNDELHEQLLMQMRLSLTVSKLDDHAAMSNKF